MNSSTEARIDKWLWAARIFKTRTIAAAACKKGQVSLKGSTVKASRMIKVGDIIEYQVNLKDFGRTAVLASKSITTQGVRTKQRENTYDYFKKLENEMVTATVTNITEKAIILDLGNSGYATMPKSEVGPTEEMEIGKRFTVYIKSVENTGYKSATLKTTV